MTPPLLVHPPVARTIARMPVLIASGKADHALITDRNSGSIAPLIVGAPNSAPLDSRKPVFPEEFDECSVMRAPILTFCEFLRSAAIPGYSLHKPFLNKGLCHFLLEIAVTRARLLCRILCRFLQQLCRILCRLFDFLSPGRSVHRSPADRMCRPRAPNDLTSLQQCDLGIGPQVRSPDLPEGSAMASATVCSPLSRYNERTSFVSYLHFVDLETHA